MLTSSKVVQALKGAFDSWKLRFRPRTKRDPRLQRTAGRRATCWTAEPRGRPVRARRPTGILRTNLALLPTVVQALLRQGPRVPLRIVRGDLREWVRQGRAPLTIVLIADISASTFHFLKPMEHVLTILYRDAYRNRDKLGLVAIQDGKTQIIAHPSRNLHIVLGALTRLAPSGMTPLADALQAGLSMLKQERRRQALFNPLAVLLSDGHPEPISSPGGDLFATDEYQAVFAAAKHFRAQKIPIVVVNPAHGRLRNGDYKWGTRLGMEVAALSRGQYYGVPEGRYERDPTFFERARHNQLIELDSRNLSHLLTGYRERPDVVG